ncbi:Acyl transferase domain-containing protein [Streptomyces sp. yr375]|uniref:type I polyketide synthase n=1 Tax=Streptomyces sp. yr375 TaxID=1761906 RepID=UPI0008B4A361|nr:type I polyketide synthase [Streptomyces sp. yr375]SES40850.1 Acyl transferase domain-containing protein [Streptomyces sp. yr375]
MNTQSSAGPSDFAHAGLAHTGSAHADFGHAGSPHSESLAVIGMSCRLPGAAGPEEFWALLRDGADAVTAPPADRPLPDACPPFGGYLDQVDSFDEGFFRISPREAAAMDPQQRLVLELGWEALEDAGLPADTVRHTATGVFLGAIADDYAALHRGRTPDQYAFTGLARGVLAGRVSYALGLRGPSLTVDTGQSSSLVAVHLAGQSLRRGESRIALAGGVHLNLAPDSALRAARADVLSPDGRCHTFDARANGFVRGEGGGLVVLKRLSDALADGDRIHGVILGSAVNNDGGGETLTAPDPEAQTAVIRAACQDARVRPDAVRYVELHGTGTPKGDPVEATALGAALCDGRSADDPLRVGSVKTNIGHLEGAAGIAGLLKTLLSLKHRQLPASLHFRTPNPAIALDRLGLRVQQELGPWPQGQQLLAGVSSFGIGGTNCHVVLGEATAAAHTPDTAPGAPLLGGAGLWPVTARTEPALRGQAARLAAALRAAPDLDPADVAFSLATTRQALDHRAAVTGTGREELLRGLDALAGGQPAPGLQRGRALDARPIMVFPGQGQQWVGMGRELLRTTPVFAQWIARCETALAPYVDWSLTDVLTHGVDGDDSHDGDEGGGDGELNRLDVLQPVLWAVMVSLAELWRAAGVRPAAVIGHSQGEIAAAVVAGALTLEDGARTAALRARALRAVAGTGGGMLSLVCDQPTAEDIAAPHGGRVALAVLNGPDAMVLSGPAELLEQCAADCARRAIRHRQVAVDYASHSPLVEPLEPALRDLLAPVTPLAPTVPMLSTTTTEWVRPGELDGRYWYENLRRPVRLHAAVQRLARAGHRLFIEVGPHPVLTAGIQATLEAENGGVVLGTLRRGDGGPARFLDSLAEAFVQGAEVGWDVLYAGTDAARVDLPTYAFQRRRHWPDAAADTAAEMVAAPVASTGADAVAEEGLGGLGAMSPAEAERFLTRTVRTHAAALLGHASPDDVDPELSFRDLGFDSQLSVRLRGDLNAATGAGLGTSAVFDHPTPRALAHRLRELLTGGQPGAHGHAMPDATPDSPDVRDARDAIAIVGMSCRYAGGVGSPEELWDLVLAERDAVGDFPDDRGWDLAALLAPGPDGTPASATGQGGFLTGAADFDAEFFGISPREAVAMDPQQRLLLETSWEAFERAGIDPHSLRGSRTGVFVGAMAQDYGPRMDEPGSGADGYVLTGTSVSLASGRVAYTLGLEGPAVTVDTACSSSLVALHLAVQSLRSGECDMALAGGATVLSSPGLFVEFSRQGGLSSDGRCKAFAAGADGTGWGEGVGLLLVERLSDARRNGHEVLAVVRGSAVNQDGASNGLTAPNGPSQQRVISEALSNAGLTASDVDAVEAHGTGTALGDPIEAEALLATYGQRGDGHPLLLGSVKSNIGHTQAAAGVAGVIKMVMGLRHGVLPASLHVDEPSSFVDWSSGAVEVVRETVAWPDAGRVRRAAVSSFGISGTNAHVILEQAEAFEPVGAEESPVPVPVPVVALGGVVPWVVSGRGAGALAAQAERLVGYAGRGVGAVELPCVAYALAGGRAVFADRAVVLGRGLDELTSGVGALASGLEASGVVAGSVVGSGVVFVFPGQGAQWVGMGRELLVSSPVFAASIAECEAALSPWVDWSLTGVLAGDGDELARVDVVQPVLWAVMVSLAAVWRSVGVTPVAVVGHSQGEIAAACVAGALSLEDAARVVAVRSRAITRLAGTGGMVSVFASVDEVEPLLSDGVGIAAVNGPGSVVVSGSVDELDVFMAGCEVAGVQAKRVAVDYASHSVMVEALEAELLAELDAVVSRRPTVPMLSTYTGDWVKSGELNGGYWYGNLRHRVRLADAVGELVAAGHRLFVEVSPHPVLLGALQDTLDDSPATAVALGTLRRDQGGVERLLTSVAQAFVHGADVDWTTVLPAAGAGRGGDLPTYAFQRRRYWLRPGGGVGHPFMGEATELADGGAVFTRRIAPTAQSWLADHAVLGTVVVPGTALLEAAVHAGQRLGCERVEELTLEAPLTVPRDGAVRLQVRVGPRDDTGRRELEIHACPADTDTPALWTRHAGAVLAEGRDPSAPVEVRPLDVWPPEGAEPLELAALYEDLARRGYDYGPVFQGLRAVWRDGDEVYAAVALPEQEREQAARYALHPALLDAALHAVLLGERTGLTKGDGLLLPFSWSDVTVSANGADELRVRLRPTGVDTVSLLAVDADGEPVVDVRALALRPVAADALAAGADTFAGPGSGSGSASAEQALYVTDWVPVEAAGAGACALLGPDLFGLAELLGRGGSEVTGYPEPAALAEAVAAGEVGPGHAVVVCAPLPEPGTVSERLYGEVRRVLELAQAWLADERFAELRLTVVTRGAVARDSGDGLADPVAAAVWGLVRSAQSEHPDRLRLLDLDQDLDPGAPGADSSRTGLALVAAPQACLRDGVALAPRLTPVYATAPSDLDLDLGDGRPWRVTPGSGGTLESLGTEPARDVLEPLGPGQVRVAVRAAGVNFRDVLIALGMYPDPGVPLGMECAGVVTALGTGECGELAVGDRVFGVVTGGLAPLVVTDARLLARIPAHWSFARAAAVPIVFLTAWYAWQDLAGLRAGEKVLVHAGAGGVGMAAIQLARHLGAEVYATASPGKWDVLRQLGLDDDHIASSRDLGFAEKFPGVDVVLNSLAGEFVDASLQLLSTGGRFVEMGKTDIRDAAQVDATQLDVSYRAFDLFEAGPERLGELLAEVSALLAAGGLEPLPVQAWDIRRVRDAFRYMSQARHVGKVVLTVPRPLDPNGTVLVTGGTGGLGALVARHLVTGHGVRNLLLLSRRGQQAPGAKKLAAELTELGADVRVVACDTADRAALAEVIASVPADHPLTAVVHTAGVLDDGVIASQDATRLRTVIRPKVEAAWHLHELTAHLDLAAFVLFSSAMGVLGAPGQANYAAANAALDALAAHRQYLGLPGLSLAWGFWERRGGMTGHLDDADVARMTRTTGLAPLADDDGMALLDAALRRPEAALAPVRLSPAALRARAAAGSDLGLLRDLAMARTATVPTALIPTAVGRTPARRAAGAHPGGLGERRSPAEELAALPDAERRRVLTRLVKTHVATVLGHGTAGQPAGERTFKELGFDSLTAVELRNRLGTATGVRLAATMIFDHPTLDALTEHLMSATDGATADGGASGAASGGDPAAAVDPLVEVERLEALLRRMPADAEQRGAIATRMYAFLSTWTVSADATQGGDGDDLSLASDEELFELLDSDLGLS